jgi:thioesterase domain-containing protein
MKKVVAVVMVLIGMSSFAQKPAGEGEKFTTAQRVNLRLKKLTLTLDLTDAQARQLKPIVQEQAEKRKAKQEMRKAMQASGKKPTADARYEMQMARLDEQIALNKKVKSILNEKQYEQWKKSQMHRKHGKRGKHKKGAHKGKMKGKQ